MRAVLPLTLCVLLVAACSGTQPVVPSVVPVSSPATQGGVGGLAPSVWAFSGALLVPPDPNAYSDVIVDAKSLSDGGWIVLHAPAPRPRFHCDPLSYGCGLTKPPLAILERLDASGRVVAREHGSEPFGLTRIKVFEGENIVVGEGPQVVNGSVHAFRLDTLDGIASELATGCIAAGTLCYSARPDHSNGITTIEERDAHDLRLLRSWVKSGSDAPSWPIAVFPASNLMAWRNASRASPFVSVAALDDRRPVGISWLTRLTSACNIDRIADDRAVITFGPPDCVGAAGWHAEIVEISTGRTLRVIAADDGLEGAPLTRGYAQLASSGVVIDPRDGSEGPALGGDVLSIDWDRGVAVMGLADGGAAVLNRRVSAGASRDLSFHSVATADCDYQTPRVMTARADLVKCEPLVASTGANRVLVATGRSASGPRSFAIARVTADPVTRVIDITYAPSGRRSNVIDPSATSVIEIADPPPGEWLVRLSSDSLVGLPFVLRF